MLFAQLLCSKLCANLQGYTDEPNRQGVSFSLNQVFTTNEFESSVHQLDLDIFAPSLQAVSLPAEPIGRVTVLMLLLLLYLVTQ